MTVMTDARRRVWWLLSAVALAAGIVLWLVFGTRDNIDTLTRDANLTGIAGVLVGLGLSTIWSLAFRGAKQENP